MLYRVQYTVYIFLLLANIAENIVLKNSKSIKSVINQLKDQQVQKNYWKGNFLLSSIGVN